MVKKINEDAVTIKRLLKKGFSQKINLPIIMTLKAEGQLLGKSWDKDNLNKKENAPEILYITNLQDDSR